MNKDRITASIMKKAKDDFLQKALDILEADDGKSFEEKKVQVLAFLRSEESLLSKTLENTMEQKNKRRQINEAFWSGREAIPVSDQIVLRKVQESDREDYIRLRRIYILLSQMIDTEDYWDMIWREHAGNSTLMFSVVHEDDYAGFCGINHIAQQPWEIAIELFPEKTGQGIGTAAITAMLNEIKHRLGISDYRVRIDPKNVASQRLFEKLGAIPNGIAEFVLHDSEALHACEEENLHKIDASLISVAEKFSVKPRKLLSHVLEYKLVWK